MTSVESVRLKIAQIVRMAEEGNKHDLAVVVRGLGVALIALTKITEDSVRSINEEVKELGSEAYSALIEVYEIIDKINEKES